MWKQREVHLELTDLDFQNLHDGLALKPTTWGSHTPMPFFDNYIYFSTSAKEDYVFEKLITRKSPIYRADTKHSVTVRVHSPSQRVCDKIVKGIEEKVALDLQKRSKKL